MYLLNTTAELWPEVIVVIHGFCISIGIGISISISIIVLVFDGIGYRRAGNIIYWVYYKNVPFWLE